MAAAANDNTGLDRQQALLLVARLTALAEQLGGFGHGQAAWYLEAARRQVLHELAQGAPDGAHRPPAGRLRAALPPPG